MSINIVCYSSYPCEEATKLLDKLKSENKFIFDKLYHSYSVRNIEATNGINSYYWVSSIEIAKEFGFKNPLSLFIFLVIGAKDETIPDNKYDNVAVFADLIRKYFGKDNVLVLFQNESVL